MFIFVDQTAVVSRGLGRHGLNHFDNTILEYVHTIVTFLLVGLGPQNTNW